MNYYSSVAYLMPQNETLPTPRSQVSGIKRLFLYYKQFLDSQLLFHLIISALVFCFGLVVLESKILSNPEDSPQLWVFGPIFIAAGCLVFIRGIAQWIIKIRRRNQNPNVSTYVIATELEKKLLPSYSGALLCPVPNCVLENEVSKIGAIRTISVNVDEQPPNYVDAIKMMEKSKEITAKT